MDIKRHKNKGAEMHMRMLGIQDTKSWGVVAMDDKLFEGSLVRAKPDYVLIHDDNTRVIVVNWKSRDLGEEGSSSEYEMHQVVIEALVVREVLSEKFGSLINVAPILVYGDSQKRVVEYTPEEAMEIAMNTSELATEDHKISASKLAQLLSGADFSDKTEQDRRYGVKSHETLIELGPTIH